MSLCLDGDFQNASYRRHYVAPGDGDLAASQPGSGITMSYDDLEVIEAHRLISSIATGQRAGATIDDAVIAARIIDAMGVSISTQR